MSNYHHILGVPEDATEAEIKKAYKRLAAKHHPDKGGDAEEFDRIKDAYDHLTGKKKEPCLVSEYLMTLFDKFFEVPGDIVESIRNYLDSEIHTAETFINNSHRKIAKLNKQLNRVKAKKGDNLYKLVIKGHINEREHQLAATKEQLKLVRQTVIALDNYYDEGVTDGKLRLGQPTPFIIDDGWKGW